jgi:putative methionine-R-sulfoxide reductase with GAF domain
MSARMQQGREYAPVRAAMGSVLGDRVARMRTAADRLWETFGGDGPRISWIGFYVKAPGRDEMVLGPCRDKPACSPIGLHGACGRAWSERSTLVVRDVAALGEGYIACDPRDRSELVVPLFEGGTCWGVLDADSYDAGAFTADDAASMNDLMWVAGLTDRDVTPIRII